MTLRFNLLWQFLLIGSEFLDSYVERDSGAAFGLGENEFHDWFVMSAWGMEWGSYPGVCNIRDAPGLKVTPRGPVLLERTHFPIGHKCWSTLCAFLLQTKKYCSPFQFYKDQVMSHCSCWPTVHPERNSGWSILCFRYMNPWIVKMHI